jgi:nucleoside-diphosphate-sugar epimerase
MSLSHLGDFARAALDLWQRRAPFGIYNMTNPGAVSTRQVVALIQSVLKAHKQFEFWNSDAEFYQFVKAPRSNCILDASKLLAAGVHMRPVNEALVETLERWPEATRPGMTTREQPLFMAPVTRSGPRPEQNAGG